MYKLYQMKGDPAYTVQDVVLAAIDLITARKNRPNLARIFRNLHKIYNFSLSTCEAVLDQLLKEGRVVKVTYKNNISYRNTAHWKKYSYHIRKKMQRDIPNTTLGAAVGALVVEKPEYLDSGVPYKVLENFMLSAENGTCHTSEEVKQLLLEELKNDSIVRLENGNYLYKAISRRAHNIIISDDSDNSMFSTNGSEAEPEQEEEQQSEVNESAEPEDIFDDDDDDDDEPVRSEDDTPYVPQKRSWIRRIPAAAVKKSERNSARFKKTKYDPSEYVFPSLKRKSKQSPKTPVKKIKKDDSEVPSKKKASDPDYTSKSKIQGIRCNICRLFSKGNTSEPMISCKSCRHKGHPICVEKEQLLELNLPYNKDAWQCQICRKKFAESKKSKTASSQPEAICTFCGTPNSEYLGHLIKCVSCGDSYHKKCHRSNGTFKQTTNWKCPNCTPKESLEKLKQSRSSSPADIENVILGERSEVHTITLSEDEKSDKEISSQKTEPSVILISEDERSDKEISSQISTNTTFYSSEESPEKKGVKSNSSTDELSPRSLNGSDSSKSGDETKDEQETDRNENTILNGKNCVDQKDEKEDNCEDPTSTVPDPTVPDPTPWSTKEVHDYFLEHFNEDVAKTFIEQDIDGYALKLMKRSDVLKGMGFKLGIGLKVLFHIKRLQLRSNNRKVIWADAS